MWSPQGESVVEPEVMHVFEALSRGKGGRKQLLHMESAMKGGGAVAHVLICHACILKLSVEVRN